MSRPPEGPVVRKGPRWTHNDDKPKNLTEAMKNLLKYMGKERKYLYIGMILAISSSVLSLIGPQYLSQITDAISDGIESSVPADLAWVAKLGLILIVLYGTSLVFSVLQAYYIGAASERIGDKARRDLARKFDRLPLGYMESHNTGDLMSRMSNDTDTLRTGAAECFSMLLISVSMLFGSLVMMLYTEWRLAVFAILPALTGFAIIWYVTHNTQKYFTAQQRDLGVVNGIVEEVYYGHDIVKTYDNTENNGVIFDTVNQRLFDSSFKARVITGTVPEIMHFISNFGYVIVCVVGSMMILQGSMGFGTIVAFTVYIKQFTRPVAEIADVIARMQSVASASERILSLLDEKEMEESSDCVKSEKIRGEIEFRDVHFGYDKGSEIIHGLNLKADAGDTVAIVGPTGAGKTTLINLLIRFYDTDSGDILIDGISSKKMTRELVREQFSVVLQDPWVFEGTVAENIGFNGTDVTMDRVEECCKIAGIDDFVRTLPNGYDTVLEGETAISVGQKQQLVIARALLKDAPVVILDEATSSVDTRTEKRIQDAMNILTRGKTTFVIAHRLSTIRNADHILVMDKGRIIESGTHEQLLGRSGFYKNLYDSQFADTDML
jgi:ATP-binding cassette subfamily B multidrug efflux pump